MKKLIFPIVASVIVCGLVWQQIQRRQEREHPVFSGTLELTEYSVGARVAGRLAEVAVEEGQKILKGHRVASLDRFGQAVKDLKRVEELHRNGGASLQELEHARLAAEDQDILSPVDGTVLVKVREAGEVVGAGAPVAVIGDDQKMWVRVFVPEGLIGRVHVGQEASVRIDGVDGEAAGRVSHIALKAEFTPRNIQTPEERVTQAFAVKVAVENPRAGVRPGVAADVVFDLSGRRG